MRTIYTLIVLSMIFIVSCGTSEKSEDKSTTESTPKPAEVIADPLENKGVGPITSLTLDEAIDDKMVAHGQEVFETKCTACHKADKRFIGPAVKGILERRSPEWVMNMILDPEKMTKEDPDAKKLLMEYNGAPMANQNLTEEDARAVLEYFRTL